MSYLTTEGRVFRDPIHGLIEFSGIYRPLQSIIETRAFQRLRRIHQMGFAGFVYLGAEHSRFGHSLGAYHIATRILQKINLDEETAIDVATAALLHDIGHGPFSHAWEEVFSHRTHEDWGKEIIQKEPELVATLRNIRPDLPESLIRLWSGKYKYSFARKLVASDVDCDRLDYLLRDGHYTGVRYANYDLDWIIHALRLSYSEDGQPIDLILDSKRGLLAVEQYLSARSYMYEKVYQHKTVHAAESMFVRMFHRFRDLIKEGNLPSELPIVARISQNSSITATEYLSLDDITIVSAIDRWCWHYKEGSSDPTLHNLAKAFTKRHFFKCIELISDPQTLAHVQEHVEHVATKHFGDHAKYYYRIDTIRKKRRKLPTDSGLRVIHHPKTEHFLKKDIEQPIIRLDCARELYEELFKELSQFSPFTTEELD